MGFATIGKNPLYSCLIFALLFILPSSGSGLESGLVDWQDYFLQLRGIRPTVGLSFSIPSLPLLRLNSSYPKREIKINPENWSIEFRKVVHQVEVSPPIVLSLDEYLRLNKQVEVKRLWRENWRSPALGKGDEEAGGALKVDIPIKFPAPIGRVIGQGGQLKVTGSRKISFSGRSEWTEGEVQTATSRPSKFPALNMEQRSRFTIEGTVGQKVHVLVDQDSERISELENSIRIRYDGDEDEVIQEIEGGNITLSLPNTEFSGYSEQHRGLFGLKARAKIGGLELMAIASQEKGSEEKASFQAGAEEKVYRIKDIDYLSGTYFFLDSVYVARYFIYKNGLHTYDPADSIIDIKVYVDDRNPRNNAEKSVIPGWAVIDPDAPDTSAGGENHYGYFHLLQPEEYFVDRRLGFIVLDKPIREGEVLAVIYQTPRQRVGVGPDESSDEVLLKLIRPENPRSYLHTWMYEWRNVYYLGAKNISEEGFDLRIYLDLPSGEDEDTQDGVPFLQIFGLDRYDLDGNPNPDDRIDLIPEIINLQQGKLVFPDLRPFDPDTIPEGYPAPLKVRVPEIYDTHDYRAKSEASRYYLEVRYLSRQATYSLGKMNILEGSEVVTLNGRRLTRGVDYDIIYEIGQITFLTDEALNPNANITVDFEYAPFFVPEQRTLLGVRGEYHFWKDSCIGSTLLYRDQTIIERKARLGREPSRNFLWDANLALKFKPEFMTTLVDALPLVESDAPSSLNILAEVAKSVPNPNTKGEAFIDDFEGGERKTSLGVMRGVWTKSSVPVASEGLLALADSTRGRLIWYNPWDQVDAKEIWPNLDSNTPAQDRAIHVLTLEFTPNPSNSVPDTCEWGGIMRALPVASFDQSRSKYLEMWIKGEGAILHIDLGAISEDVIPNGVLDTEDKGRNALERNDILDEDEDTGLDGLFDPEEPGYDPVTNPDPNGDNWSYDNKYDYSHINGTEGNRNDPDRGARPDTEDINGNGILDLKNDYFEYIFELGDSSYIDGGWKNPYGWRLYRIPLDQPARQVGEPDMSLIEFARLWISGVESGLRIQIATFDLVANVWEEWGIFAPEGTAPVDPTESFAIAVKNTHENDDYSSPPGVSGERDLITKIEHREQSLVLRFENLRPGHRASAYQTFYSAQNFIGYRTLRMYVYGNEQKAKKLGKAWEPEHIRLFLRFGADSSNYYQYHTQVYPGWDSRNEVVVNLDEITRLKSALLSSLGEGVEVPDTTHGNYRVYGRPSLTDIRYLEVGVENVADDATISGEIWVDELRLTDVRRDVGWASRATVEAQFADFADLMLNFRNITSDFHGVRETWGPGNTSMARDLRIKFKLGKFFPQPWGLSLPLNVSWAERIELPKYEPGSDVLLDRDQRWQQRSAFTTRTIDLSFRKAKPSPSRLVGFTLDRTLFSFSAADKGSRSPTYPERKSTAYNTSITYDLTPRTSRWLSPLGWARGSFLPQLITESEFYYLPSRLIFNAALDRVRSYSVNHHLVRIDNYTCYFTQKLDFGYHPLNSLFTDYTLKIRRDSRWAHLHRLQFGREVDRWQTVSLSYRPRLFRWSTQSFSYQANYYEDNDVLSRAGALFGRNADNSVTRTLRLSLNPSLILDSLLGPKRKVKSKKPYGPLDLLELVVRRTSNLSTTLHQTKRFSLYGLARRPDFLYQLGLVDDPGVESHPGVGETNKEHWTQGWDLKAGFELFQGVSLTSMYEYDCSTYKTSTAQTGNQGVTFPKLVLHWGSLGQMAFLRNLVSSSSLDFGYWKKSSRAWIIDPVTGEETPDNEEEMRSFSPLFSWTTYWRNGLRSTIESDWTFTERANFLGSGGKTRSSTKSYTVSLDYSFSAPQGIVLPLWKLGRRRIKFTSKLNLAVDLNWRENWRENDLQKRRSVDTEEWTLITRAGYTFSRRVIGGMALEVGNQEDKVRRQTRKVREFSLWTEFRFD